MKPVRCVVSMPPSFILVTDAEGKRWLNTHRILSMRELPDGALVELDTGEVTKVTNPALAPSTAGPHPLAARSAEGSSEGSE